ncbi:MAG: MerR family DNA-binding transcriptional regulator [Micrococcales bacterium]|nr:MAG: MerR family DNA-binding transcriptional regulator [Micrococcales bacterium]PIE26478.1 MAG: MerR family DNA-binding transcriptional regulator [Micrococcales bacterium]
MSNSSSDNGERLMTPQEVAAMFSVSPKTVARWAAAGKISAVRTLGGHRRYRESEALALLRAQTYPSVKPDLNQR